MYLLYMDESGSTGLDLANKEQPFFVLTGVCILDKNWHKINDYFEQEKIKIYPDLKNIEIHTNELFNSNQKSHFYRNNWKDNFSMLEKIVNLISNLDIKLTQVTIYKKSYSKCFGNNIIIDPYLYSFTILYENFNEFLIKNNDYGIIFCDELKDMQPSLEFIYPKLKVNNKNIIEKAFYLNSKKNNFIQIADVCSFYINKYNCINNNLSTMGNFKKEHCVNMYNLLSEKIGNVTKLTDFNNFNNYFK